MLNKFSPRWIENRSILRQRSGGLRQFAAIIQAINDLARNLGIKVVAEGVETREQLVLLQSLNCEFAQGYLFSRPVYAADLATLPRDRSNILSKVRPASA